MNDACLPSDFALGLGGGHVPTFWPLLYSRKVAFPAATPVPTRRASAESLGAIRLVEADVWGPKRPNEHKDPTNHGFWYPPLYWTLESECEILRAPMFEADVGYPTAGEVQLNSSPKFSASGKAWTMLFRKLQQTPFL